MSFSRPSRSLLSKSLVRGQYDHSVADCRLRIKDVLSLLLNLKSEICTPQLAGPLPQVVLTCVTCGLSSP
jgi:hypothetical protein